jgi:argininosuccinate lyase
MPEAARTWRPLALVAAGRQKLGGTIPNLVEGRQIIRFADHRQIILSMVPLLDSSCLGAGVGGGTSLAIRPDLTARLLGFASAPVNSLDCVASRDLVLRLLAALAILGSNLGRIAETMLIWVGDAALIVLPDNLVGSSSAMPQKRNPFLLEHVQGKAAAIAGHFVAALMGMHAAPFTNSVAVGTEASRHVWPGLRETTDTLCLARLCVSGMTVAGDAAAVLLRRSFVNATEVATHLAVSGALDFRTAHNVVGRLVTAAVQSGTGTIFEVPDTVQLATLAERRREFEPDAIARSARAGGGPAPDTVAGVLDHLEQHIGKSAESLRDLENQWNGGRIELRGAIARIRERAFASASSDNGGITR